MTMGRSWWRVVVVGESFSGLWVQRRNGGWSSNVAGSFVGKGRLHKGGEKLWWLLPQGVGNDRRLGALWGAVKAWLPEESLEEGEAFGVRGKTHGDGAFIGKEG